MAAPIFSARVNKQLAKQLDDLAARRGIARNSAIVEAIKLYIRAGNRKQTKTDSEQVA